MVTSGGCGSGHGIAKSGEWGRETTALSGEDDRANPSSSVQIGALHTKTLRTLGALNGSNDVSSFLPGRIPVS